MSKKPKYDLFKLRAKNAARGFCTGLVMLTGFPGWMANCAYFGKTYTSSAYVAEKAIEGVGKDAEKTKGYHGEGFVGGTVFGAVTGMVTTVITLGIPTVALTLADAAYNSYRLGKKSIGKGSKGLENKVTC